MRALPKFIIGSSLLFLPLRSMAQVVINEVSAANWDLLMADGEYEDWIELYNSGGGTADLSGFFLSDKASDPGKWQIPAGTTIPANGHLLFFASKKDGVIAGEYHTNFKLTQTAQEDVVLADPSLTIVDQFHFDAPTQKNHSWGRTTDGAGTWNIFTTPTPAAANAGASPYYTPRPVLDPPAGGYCGSVNFSMSADPGCTIRYTLDGTEPTVASTAYAAPVAINATTCVRAESFSSTPGVLPSFIETNTYFINETHTVPVWSIAGGADVLDILNNGGSTTIAESNLEYFDASLVLLDETFGEFNEHGGTSNSNDQRGMDYIVRDEFGYDHQIENQLFRGKDRDKFERIILKAAAGDNYPGYDGAHIRDAYVQSLGQKIGMKLDSRTYEPCVAYVNGQYWGVYETREKVDDNDYTEHYYDQPGEHVDMIQQYGGVWADYGDVNGWWNLYNFIMGNDMTVAANYAQVKDTLNTLSMIDHMIINEYMVNGSWLLFNTMWWRGKDPGGDHKKFGYCCWDMDWILGVPYNEFGFPEETPVNDPCDHTNVDVGGQPSQGNLAGTHFDMFNALMANDEFREQYLDRYADLINSGLSCASTVQHLDSLTGLIDPEMTRHCSRWGGTYNGWQANVQQMRTFLQDRCAFIEQGLVDCYQVVPHDIVVQVMPPGSGMVHLNTLDLTAFPWNGTYFDSLLLEFRAEAYATWDFDHWTTDSNTVVASVLDSAMYIRLVHGDTITAWFKPDVQYPVLLDVEPHNAGDILFGTDLISTFPYVAGVSEDVPYGIEALPHTYFDFVRWEVRQHPFSPGDSLLDSINIRFFGPDTIIAHFKPHDFGYFVPNAFTPNGDGYNDAWLPLGDRVDLDRYDLRVFDRWGEQVFASADFTEAWDGTLAGNVLPPEVYVYHIQLRDAITREKKELFGYVTLVR
jgi:gliding motility-associated-like protein